MEVSAEVHFAQTLAANEKKIRDRALKRLKKYIGVRVSNGAGMSHDDYIKIWKGLHYCMWMQDKPLIQEELSQKMVELLGGFPQLEQALKFVNVFFITEAREWTGIDKFRLDKFMMLMRDMLHETFVLLSREEWPVSECQTFAQNLAANVTNENKSKIPYGIKMHLAEIFVTELRKVSQEGLDGKKLTFLMFPFIYFLLKTKRRDLAQSMYGKTLQLVFKLYGDWPWGVDRKQQEKTLANQLKKSQKLTDDDDDEVEMESEDEEIEDSNEEEEMDADEDDEEKGYRRRKFDLRVMLRLLLRLAKDPSVESRNRSYVYGIVKSFTGRDSELLSSGSGDDSNDDLDVTSVCQLIGEAEENKSDKKPKKKKRQQFEKEAADAMEINNNKNNSAKQNLQTSKKSKKKKGNVNNNEEKNPVVPEKLSSKSDVKVKKRKRSSVGNDSFSEETSAKKLKTVDNDIGLNGVHVQASITSPENTPKQSKKNKKRKSLNSTNENLNASSEDVAESCADSENSNTNALGTKSPSGRGKNKMSFSCPVQYVVYPQKSNVKQMDGSSQPALSKPQNIYKFFADGSPTRTVLPETNIEDAAKDKKNEKFSPTESPKTGKAGNIKKTQSAPVSTDGDGSGLMGAVYNVVAAPGSLIKKAVGMFVPSSKSPSGSKTGTTPEQLTPTSQKKVVFDLKRNTANKFKDYLKTLANDPSPAYEPSKSPAQGILKSPSTSSLNSLDSNSLDSMTPNTKRKGRRGSKSPRTPVRRR